jgi:hypothetical protein
MKLMIRSLTMFLLSVGLAQSVLAQNPAVRMTQGSKKECVRVTLKNLSPKLTLTVATVVFRVFDQATCNWLCTSEQKINKKIEPCQSLGVEVCCPKQLPPTHGYIYWLRIGGSVGGGASGLLTEAWLFTP